jgi:ligand-binding sensor domain-containing protein/signal transduction histidine kinase
MTAAHGTMRLFHTILSEARHGGRRRNVPAAAPRAAIRPAILPRICAWAGCALALFLTTSASALTPQHDLPQYSCQSWTRQNGLPVNGVTSLVQSSDGYLWLGTSAGLVRFDGVHFKLIDLARVPNLRSSIVNTIATSRDGGLWVGLLNGSFAFYDGKTLTPRGGETRGRMDMNVRRLFETPDGTLWIAGQRNGAKLTPDQRYEEIYGTSANNDINILTGYVDPSGRMWFGTAFSGVSYWENGRTHALPDPTLADVPVLAITQDREGQIWVGTGQDLRCYDAQFRRKEIPPLAADITTLLADSHGTLWIGTNGGGLIRYRDGVYQTLGKQEGLASAYVKAILEDREGSLWIATQDGLSQLSDIKFPTYRAAEDRAVNDAWSVSPSRHGGVWIGSPRGVTYFDGKHKTYFTEAGLAPEDVKRTLEARNGDVYLITGRDNRRLLILSNGKVVASHTRSSMFVGLAEDAQGVIVSNAGLLYRVGRDGLVPYAFEGPAPDMVWVLNLLVSRDGTLWAATQRGVFRIKDGAFTRYTDEHGLADAHAEGLCEDQDGIIWLWTLAGLGRLKDGRVTMIDHDDGLFDNDLYAVVPDDFGYLWIDSGRGIFRVSRKSLAEFADGKIARVECTAYTGSDSVRTTDKTYQQRVGCRTPDGRIWFPGPRGVVMIDPARISTNPIAPPVLLDRVVANGREMPVHASAVVPPGQGELEFHFTGLSFIASQRVKFRYRLEGYDRDWVEADDRRFAFYTNLPPGRYSFHVTAANADGVWNERGATMAIQLRPHFHQTGWFYTLCGGAVLAGLAGVSAWRVRHLKNKQRALQRSRDQLEAEVTRRTAELAGANASLSESIEHHKRTQEQLELRTKSLEREIEQRTRMEAEVSRIHKKLLEASRQAGMAEVATGVLHNVGNVLNSVNVSATLIGDRVRLTKAANIAKLAALVDGHKGDLARFVAEDPRGRMIPTYLNNLAETLAAEQTALLGELENLRKNVEHIKEIVAMQQSYASASGVTETLPVLDLVEDSLRMNSGALARHEVELVRDYRDAATVTTDKHKVMQILINLVRNAKYACDETGRTDKQITVRVTSDDRGVKIAVIDNGVGIPPENLTRIFNHGFTTRKDGHGFGLHSGALAAREIGGALTVHSDGPGRGATFVLEIPFHFTPSASTQVQPHV